MSWNHRIADVSAENGGEPCFKLVECYYDGDGKPMGYADLCDVGDTPQELASCLERMLSDIRRNPRVIRLRQDGGIEELPITDFVVSNAV